MVKISKVRSIFLIVIAMTVGCLSNHAQLLMNSGDVYTHSFSDLPFVNNAFAPTPRALMNFTVDSLTLETGDMLFYEMFADAPGGSLICSGTLNGPPGPSPGGFVCVAADAGWDDLQGAVRFTMLSGSLTLESIQVGALRSGGPTLAQFYSTTVTPVPEPSPLALFAVGVLSWMVWYRKRKVPHDETAS